MQLTTPSRQAQEQKWQAAGLPFLFSFDQLISSGFNRRITHVLFFVVNMNIVDFPGHAVS